MNNYYKKKKKYKILNQKKKEEKEARIWVKMLKITNSEFLEKLNELNRNNPTK